jgi:hypothetical protein
MRIRSLLALPAAAMLAAPLVAQNRNTPSLSIEANGVYTGVARSVFPNVGDGRGGEAQATLGIGNFAISGGVSRTWHDVSGAPTNPLPGVSGADGATLTTFFVEPRLALPLGVSNFTPYLYGRAGQTNYQYTTNGDDLGARQRALMLGGGAGVIVELFKGAALNLGGGYQWHRAGNSFGDQSRPSGGGYMVRAGLMLGGTRWARDPGF